MSVSEEAVEDYIAELDELAEEILEDTRSLFLMLETTTDVTAGPNSIGYTWETPSSEAKQTQQSLIETYQEWFAGGKELISAYMRAELDEFTQLRANFYQIITLDVGPAGGSSMRAYSDAHDAFVTQRGMVNGIPRKLEAKRLNVKKQVSKAVAKDEIERAWQLFEEDLLRASGAVAGVALERHLLTLCQESDEELEFELDDTITSLAQTLHEAGEMEQPTLHQIQKLASIRGECVHADPEEPNEYKVRTLIADTEDYVRGRGL